VYATALLQAASSESLVIPEMQRESGALKSALPPPA
jgi:hypothetical protein